MRSKLLITSAAALLAGTMFAMGQEADRKDQPKPGSSQPGVSQPKGAQSEPKGQMAPKAAQKEPSKEQPKAAQKEPSKEQPKAAQKEPSKEQPKGTEKEQPGRPATTGQAPREEPNRAQGQERNQERNQGQTQERNQTQERDRVQQGQREGGSSTSVTLTTEQRTRIRETVLRGSNAPRVTKVDFAVSVGTVIPRTVRIVEVPETIIEIHPEWRRFRYFVYNDEIIIVEPDTFKIVAVFNV